MTTARKGRLAVGLIGVGRLGRVYARDLAGRIAETRLVAVADPVGTSGIVESRNTTRAYQAGYERGRTEGRQAGKEDKGVNGGHWDLEGQRELEQADSGYSADLGARGDYQSGYRAGFRLGYREGFGPR